MSVLPPGFTEEERRTAAYLSSISYEGKPQANAADGLARALKSASRHNAELSDLRVYRGSDEHSAAFVNHVERKVYVTARGTADTNDVVFQDSFIAVGYPGSMPRLAQFDKFVGQVQREYAGYEVITAGHSLGGTQSEEVAKRRGLRCYSFNTGVGLPGPGQAAAFVLSGISRIVKGRPLYDKILYSYADGDPMSPLRLPTTYELQAERDPSCSSSHAIANFTGGCANELFDDADKSVEEILLDNGIDPERKLTERETKAATHDLEQMLDVINGALDYIPGLKEEDKKWLRAGIAIVQTCLTDVPFKDVESLGTAFLPPKLRELKHHMDGVRSVSDSVATIEQLSKLEALSYAEKLEMLDSVGAIIKVALQYLPLPDEVKAIAGTVLAAIHLAKVLMVSNPWGVVALAILALASSMLGLFKGGGGGGGGGAAGSQVSQVSRATAKVKAKARVDKGKAKLRARARAKDKVKLKGRDKARAKGKLKARIRSKDKAKAKGRDKVKVRVRASQATTPIKDSATVNLVSQPNQDKSQQASGQRITFPTAPRKVNRAMHRIKPRSTSRQIKPKLRASTLHQHNQAKPLALLLLRLLLQRNRQLTSNNRVKPSSLRLQQMARRPVRQASNRAGQMQRRAIQLNWSHSATSDRLTPEERAPNDLARERRPARADKGKEKLDDEDEVEMDGMDDDRDDGGGMPGWLRGRDKRKLVRGRDPRWEDEGEEDDHHDSRRGVGGEERDEDVGEASDAAENSGRRSKSLKPDDAHGRSNVEGGRDPRWEDEDGEEDDSRLGSGREERDEDIGGDTHMDEEGENAHGDEKRTGANARQGKDRNHDDKEKEDEIKRSDNFGAKPNVNSDRELDSAVDDGDDDDDDDGKGDGGSYRKSHKVDSDEYREQDDDPDASGSETQSRDGKGTKRVETLLDATFNSIFSKLLLSNLQGRLAMDAFSHTAATEGRGVLVEVEGMAPAGATKRHHAGDDDFRPSLISYGERVDVGGDVDGWQATNDLPDEVGHSFYTEDDANRDDEGFAEFVDCGGDDDEVEEEHDVKRQRRIVGDVYDGRAQDGEGDDVEDEGDGYIYPAGTAAQGQGISASITASESPSYQYAQFAAGPIERSLREQELGLRDASVITDRDEQLDAQPVDGLGARTGLAFALTLDRNLQDCQWWPTLRRLLHSRSAQRSSADAILRLLSRSIADLRAHAGDPAARSRWTDEWQAFTEAYATLSPYFVDLERLALAEELAQLPAVVSSQGWATLSGQLSVWRESSKDIRLKLNRPDGDEDEDADRPREGDPLDRILCRAASEADESIEWAVQRSVFDFSGIHSSDNAQLMLPSEAIYLTDGSSELEALFYQRLIDKRLLSFHVNGGEIERQRNPHDRNADDLWGNVPDIEEELQFVKDQMGPMVVCLCATTPAPDQAWARSAKALAFAAMRTAHVEKRPCMVYTLRGSDEAAHASQQGAVQSFYPVIRLDLTVSARGLTDLVELSTLSLSRPLILAGYELLQCEHAPLIEAARALKDHPVAEVLIVSDAESPSHQSFLPAGLLPSNGKVFVHLIDPTGEPKRLSSLIHHDEVEVFALSADKGNDDRMSVRIPYEDTGRSKLYLHSKPLIAGEEEEDDQRDSQGVVNMAVRAGPADVIYADSEDGNVSETTAIVLPPNARMEMVQSLVDLGPQPMPGTVIKARARVEDHHDDDDARTQRHSYLIAPRPDFLSREGYFPYKTNLLELAPAVRRSLPGIQYRCCGDHQLPWAEIAKHWLYDELQNEANAADGEERTIGLQRSTVKISADRRLMVSNLPAGQQVWLWFVIWSGDRFALREQPAAVDFATALRSALFHDVPEGGEVAEVLAYDRADSQEQAIAYLRAKYQVVP